MILIKNSILKLLRIAPYKTLSSILMFAFLLMICGCKPTHKIIEKQELINFLFQDYIGEKPSASFIVIKDGIIEDCQSFGSVSYTHLTLPTTPYV